jgi:hypothetical protein
LWPRDVLRYLFLVTPATPHSAMELAAFFFGNRIPLLIAFDLFQEFCNPSPALVGQFRLHYETWGRRHDWRNMYDYYVMRLGQLVDLSVSNYA